MTRLTHLIAAAFFAALVGVFGLAPARAASIPAGPAISIDQNSKPVTEQVYHRHWHRPRHYHRRVYHRRVYHRPVYYRPAPVYHRRCVMRPRAVWTPWGYRHRWVRVCRY